MPTTTIIINGDALKKKKKKVTLEDGGFKFWISLVGDDVCYI